MFGHGKQLEKMFEAWFLQIIVRGWAIDVYETPILDG
jgi:hypothetical protein